MLISIPTINSNDFFRTILYCIYMIFFISVFWTLLKFLTNPSQINFNVISAALCGYLLLVEISAFLMMSFHSNNPLSSRNIDASSSMAVFTDMVYYRSITLTSIGFGDIVPNSH